jgi:hypothetical protein
MKGKIMATAKYLANRDKIMRKGDLVLMPEVLVVCMSNDCFEEGSVGPFFYCCMTPSSALFCPRGRGRRKIL